MVTMVDRNSPFEVFFWMERLKFIRHGREDAQYPVMLLQNLG
jgi:hypothetical protein